MEALTANSDVSFTPCSRAVARKTAAAHYRADVTVQYRSPTVTPDAG